MNGLFDLLQGQLGQRLTWTLLNFVWQGFVVVFLLAALIRILRVRKANTRYALSILALLAMVACLAATFVFVELPAQAPAPSVAKTALSRQLSGPANAGRQADLRPVVQNRAIAADSLVKIDYAWMLSLSQPYLLMFWSLGVTLLSVRLLLGLACLSRMREGKTPVTADIAQRVSRLAKRLGLARIPPAFGSARVAEAVALGFLRPMILLPAAWLADMTPEVLEAVVAHELAHIRRWDLWVNLFQRSVETLLFYHPAVWWLSRRIRREREMCCDELAVSATDRCMMYVDALQEVVRRRVRAIQPTAATVTAIGGNTMAILERVRYLLGATPAQDKIRWWPVGIFTMLVPLLFWISPVLGTKPAEEDKLSESQPSTAAEKPAVENKPVEALTYTGIVTDKLTGKPIAGATVTVRREIVAPYEHRIIEEPKYTTDAAGKYTFTIPPEQVAERFMYIELDVAHPDYATRQGFGYALSMLLKNEKLGERPFFEHVDLYPSEPITGTVVTPEGKPAAGVKVLGFTLPDRKESDSASFTDAKTDAQGFFRLNLTQGCKAVFWLLPQDYAPSTHVIGEKRGDLDRFELEQGIALKGHVVDEQEKPVAGVWVNAEIVGGASKKEYDLLVSDALERSALTDEKGEFALKPLPPGECLIKVEEYPQDNLLGRQSQRPLPFVFGPKKLTLKAGEAAMPVVVRAVPQVVVEGQFYDSRGKPRLGHQPDLVGRLDDKELGDQGDFYFARGVMDKNGRFVLMAPKGLKEAKLSFITNEHSAQRVRMTKDGPLSNQCRDIELGTLDHDLRGIEVVRYEAPILQVKPVAEDGTLLRNANVQIEYAEGKGPWKDAGRFTEGKDVSFEKQENGCRRTSQLLPDEEFTLTVESEGCESKSQKLKLSEGATLELEVKLKPALPKANDQSSETPAEKPNRIIPPAIDAEKAGKLALEKYDTNHDGKIDGKELDAAPAIRAAMDAIDDNKDGAVTAEEITARVKAWQASKIGRMVFSCKVTYKDQPLDGAEVRFIPEEFLGSNLPTATGKTDANGMAMISVPLKDDLPPGVPPGLYRVEITKPGLDIPAKYNRETTLGQEVALEAKNLQTGVHFDLQ